MRSKYVPRLPDRDAAIRINEGGYIEVYAPWHPKNFKGWYYMHRIVVEYSIGRMLKSWETVHHLTAKADNSLDNLFACTRREHDRVPGWPKAA